MRTALPCALVLAVVLAGGAPRPLAAQEADAEPEPATQDDLDPCRGEIEPQGAQLDRLREGVYTGVCTSARWFDGLFGDARDHAESYGQTHGRVGVGLAWDELDDLSFDGHLRANVQLPLLGSRFNAVIGRESDESYINDDFDGGNFLPGSFSDDRDARWYAGLNYNAIRGTNSRFDVSGGVQLQSPLNPYVKARYRYFLYPAEDLRLTARTTAFWENEDGFGVTLALDTDWSVSDTALLRWANTLRLSEVTQGVLWRSRLSWFQALSDVSALRYEVFVRGETDGIEPDRRELTVTYRRSVWRTWLFIETYAGIFWNDDEDPDRICDACAMAGVGFEMMFGDRYDESAARP